MRRRLATRRLAAIGLALLCALAAASAVGAAAAEATPADPLLGFPFFAAISKEGEEGKPYPSPDGFEGPCGLAVDSSGTLYVSDYYRRHVDAFAPGKTEPKSPEEARPKFLLQTNVGETPEGPCGLAVEAGGDLFVNVFHQEIVRYTPSPFPLTAKSTYGPGVTIDTAHPTGVAISPLTGNVYVDDRTHVSVYEPSGAPVEVGGEPLRIGEGSLLDGYGVAVSGFGTTAGHVYVSDAGDDTVKVYDPAGDPSTPVETIDGHENPLGGFVSLRDSALAVDRVTGRVYVADDLLPEFFERPEGAIYAFEPSGAYAGRLKRNVIDALPPGLAVDNSSTATQGRVYVTSGNTELASIYAYGPTAAVKSPGECAEGGPCPLQAPGGGAAPEPSVRGAPTGSGAGASRVRSPRRGSGRGGSAVAQRGNLRVAVNGSLAPSALPRHGTAPVAVSVAGRISTTDGSTPPALKTLRIEINRHGRFDRTGLPICPYRSIQPASTARALAACRAALVGQGRFEADVSLAGQEPYPARGRLLVFNGRAGGHPALLGQIYAPRPFANSFVIVFAVKRRAHGAFGTVLTASLPRALGSWGRVTGIEMRLGRRFTSNGARHSYLSAGCPAPAGFGGVSFPLARASFSFAGGTRLAPTVTRACSVR